MTSLQTTGSLSTTNDTPHTLRALIKVALRVLPVSVESLQTNRHTVLNNLLTYTDLIDIPFAKLVFDSRQLTTLESAQKNAVIKDGFVLLKSHTQPIATSHAYAKTAAAHAAFILSEVNLEPEANLKPEVAPKLKVAPKPDTVLKSEAGLKPLPLGLATNAVLNSDYRDNPAHSSKVEVEVENAHANNADVDKVDNNVNLTCPVASLPNLRNVLGTLVQLSLLTTTQHQSLKTMADLNQMFPKIVAITGTNGKTTTSQLVAQLCQLSGQSGLVNSAVMGTAGNGRLNHLRQSSHTTGDALAVQTFLHTMQEERVDILAFEASSHGLHQQRLQGVPVQVAIYTNLSRDHLDYHPDMQDYAAAKAMLFDSAHFPTLTHAVINIDDEFAALMLETASSSGLEVWTYSLDANKNATFTAAQINPSLNGVEIELVTHFGTVWLNSPLLGRFNVANLLAAIAAVMALGIELEAIPAIVTKLQGADGRMQRVIPEQGMTSSTACFIVDYAHTPDALTQVLSSLKPHCQGQLWAVFGCGGDRDSGKRPLMAQAGLALADKVILTSDNPRSEGPEAILADMQQGMTAAQFAKTTVISDRREAIQQVVKLAGEQDIVVIAGKGHETYQEINGVRHDFDDRQILQAAFLPS